jgi:hypothetical protein
VNIEIEEIAWAMPGACVALVDWVIVQEGNQPRDSLMAAHWGQISTALSWMSLLLITRSLSEATCRVFHYGFMPLKQLKEPMFFSSAVLRNALLEEITSFLCIIAEKAVTATTLISKRRS